MTEPSIYVEVTGGDQMSDRLRSALDRLSQTLVDADLLPDVEGFTTHGGTRIDIGTARPSTGGSRYTTKPGTHLCFGFSDSMGEGRECWIYFP